MVMMVMARDDNDCDRCANNCDNDDDSVWYICMLMTIEWS